MACSEVRHGRSGRRLPRQRPLPTGTCPGSPNAQAVEDLAWELQPTPSHQWWEGVDVYLMTRSDSVVAMPPDVPGIDDLDHGRRRRHTFTWLGGMSVLLLVTLPVAVGLGPVGIAPDTVTQIVTYHVFGWPQITDWSGAEDSIVWQVRMPRVLLGAVVGAGLAMTGVALQAMVRNVLADPYILGVTSGASTGAAATILFGVGVAVGASSLTASAFVVAMAATGALYLLARVGGQITRSGCCSLA